jgi:hypothetical protein
MKNLVVTFDRKITLGGHRETIEAKAFGIYIRM